MTKELCYIVDQISREKAIPKEVLLNALQSALQSAARKRFGGRTNINLRIDPKSCEITVTEAKRVVETVSDSNEEITLKEAKRIRPEANIGDIIELPIQLEDFGRIAAQTAKQVILQRVREAEKDVIYNEYKDKKGTVVSGTVIRKEKGNYYISIGRAEAILPVKETLPNENLRRGDIIKAYIIDVQNTSRGPIITLSRTVPEFVTALFRMEVPEIADGTVIIKNIVREPGERTKLAVYSSNPAIDPVGSCVGMKGTRVQAIVRELRGERIDIIPWNDDPRILITRALSPARVDRIGINEEEKTAMVIVPDDQLSIAIGKKGHNVRLAMKLTGWEIDIMSESEYSKIKAEQQSNEATE
jgi:N utilization substance protein A